MFTARAETNEMSARSFQNAKGLKIHMNPSIPSGSEFSILEHLIQNVEKPASRMSWRQIQSVHWGWAEEEAEGLRCRLRAR